MTDTPGPEAARTAERALQRGALPMLGNIPGARAVAQYTKLVLTPLAGCTMVAPFGPDAPASGVMQGCTVIKQGTARLLTDAGYNPAEAVPEDHKHDSVYAMEDRNGNYSGQLVHYLTHGFVGGVAAFYSSQNFSVIDMDVKDGNCAIAFPTK